MTTRCYGVDGVPHDVGRYIPCNTTAVENGGHTGCCARGDNCLTNGFCQSQIDDQRDANLFWRNGCTDPTWQDPACARYCVGQGAPDTHAVLYCLQAEQYCCPIQTNIDLSSGINTTCCSSSDLVFQAADPVVYTIASFDFVGTASRRPTSTAISSADTMITTTQASTATSSTQSSQSSPTSSPLPPPSSSDSKIGVYVGVPLGVVLLIALGVIAWLLVRKRRKAAAGAAYQYPPVCPPVPWQGAEKFAHVAEAGDGRTSELPAGQEVAAELHSERRQL
ncbi:hypothetical protein IQ07DRAFT_678517 [Pyrenochaeta sp. DS3sAY3a]|nr:hypothetical protein IQ07DRAFT_678517 [Pyrenochaeta sp. DS3sAY3a]